MSHHSWEESLEEHVNDLFTIHNIDPIEGWGALCEMASDNYNSLVDQAIEAAAKGENDAGTTKSSEI